MGYIENQMRECGWTETTKNIKSNDPIVRFFNSDDDNENQNESDYNHLSKKTRAPSLIDNLIGLGIIIES